MRLIRLVCVVIAGLFLVTGAHADPTIIGATHFEGIVVPPSNLTIISASANTNGVSLKTAVLQTDGAGNAGLALSDGTIIFGISSPTGNIAMSNLPYPVYLPPGVGLVLTAAVPTTVWVTYDKLTP